MIRTWLVWKHWNVSGSEAGIEIEQWKIDFLTIEVINKQLFFKIVGTTAHPSVSRTNPLMAELPPYKTNFPALSLYNAAVQEKDRGDIREALEEGKKRWSELRVQMFFYCAVCGVSLTPSIHIRLLSSHTLPGKRSIRLALACCFFFSLLPFFLLLVWLSCFIYPNWSVVSFAEPLVRCSLPPFLGSTWYARSIFKV